MPEITGKETEFKGHYGRARLIPLPDVLSGAETVSMWLLTAPQAHPVWTQYVLGCVRLRDLEGWPPPKRQFDGATHEITVVALNPEHGPATVAMMEEYCHSGRMPYLTPINIAHQIEGTDEEARILTAYAALGVVHGLLWPETSGTSEAVAEEWDGSLIKTLAHLRHEEHAE